MQSKLFGALVGALFACAEIAAAQSGAISREVPVSESFTDSALEWDGQPGGYYFKWDVIAVDGIIEVCGVGVHTNGQVRSASTRVLRKAYVALNDETILTDLTFFSRVRSKRRLENATANCTSTGVRVPNGKADIVLGWGASRTRL